MASNLVSRLEQLEEQEKTMVEGTWRLPPSRGCSLQRSSSIPLKTIQDRFKIYLYSVLDLHKT